MIRVMQRLADAAGSAAFTLLLLLLVLIPLPVGSNRDWAVMAFSLAAYLVFAMAILDWAWGGQDKRKNSPLFWYAAIFIWLGWLGWIWVQSLPMGPARLGQVAPHQAGLYNELTAVLGADNGLHWSISVAAERTRLHWLESAAYFSLFVATVLLCKANRRRPIALLWVIFLSGVFQAVYGSLMTLSGLEYGAFTRKVHYLGSATGTFVNRNHFAGYMELGLASGLGLLVAYSQSVSGNWRQRLRDWLISGGDGTAVRLLLMFLVIGLILSRSRGGNAAAVAGLGVTLLVLLMLAKGVSWRWGGMFLLGFLAVDVAILGSWFGGGLVERYIATAPETEYRLKLWPDLVRMREAYVLSGSGLGTFALAYPEFHSFEVPGNPLHAHNDYLQFWIETGVVGVTLLGLVVLLTLVHLVRVLRNRRDPKALAPAVAAFAAMASIAVHSSTDFNLQIPANAATLVTLMGLSWAVDPSRRKVRKRRTALAPVHPDPSQAPYSGQ